MFEKRFEVQKGFDELRSDHQAMKAARDPSRARLCPEILLNEMSLLLI